MMYQLIVKEFMKACDQPSDQGWGEQAALYMDLITEEYKETLDAYTKGDLVEVADGLADMVWVIMGLANTLGIPFDDIWREVKSSNMSKVVDGKMIKDENGKVQKPDTYFKPDIAGVLGK